MTESDGSDEGPSLRESGGFEGDLDALDAMEVELREIAASLPDRIEADPDTVDSGLGRLVLTLVEFIRRILEHQAIRRMEAGTLTDDEVERLGLTLLRLRERMAELRDVFGLEEEDVNLDLGPFGRLL